MKDYYTTGEAAEKLGVCVRTIQLWVESGKIPYWKTNGGHRRLDKAAIDSLTNPPLSSPASTQVLLVDDSKNDTALIKALIDKSIPDAKISEAVNGYDALIKFGQSIPDILVLDLAMPKLDGFEMLNTLKPHVLNTPLHIIIVTGLQPIEIEDRGGLPDFVSRVFFKPIKIDDFIDHLSTLTK